MRVAVVGTGFAREVHLPGYALVDGIELAAICDNRRGRAELVAAEFGAGRWCESFDDVLTMADVDVVDICTPPRLHAPMALAALAAGKAVICEKPMSSDLAAAKEMTERAAQAGARTAMGFQSRYMASYRHLRRVIANGFLGDIRLVLVTAFGDYALDPRLEPHYATWASMAEHGGGFLASAMAHGLDLTQYLFGRIRADAVMKQQALPRKPLLAWDFIHDDPLSESSPTSGTAEVTGDDTAVVQGRLAGGGVVIAAGSWAVRNGGGTRIEAYGSDATIKVDSEGNITAARGSGPLEPLAVPAELSAGFGGSSQRAADGRSAGRQDVPRLFAALAADFMAALDGREAPPDGWPFATFADGLAVQQILAAAENPS
jgi:predicted dehydrogenase